MKKIIYLLCSLLPILGLNANEIVVMDMVHHNPGEAFTVSMFNDPSVLRDYGFNGQVINEFKPPHCAITYDEFDRGTFPEGSDEREWVEELADRIDGQIAQVHAQGLKAYYFMDIILFPKSLVEKYKELVCGLDGKIDWDKPLTKELHRVMLRELFNRFPGIDGLVVRTGENYRQNIPYHAGNELVNNSRKDEAIRKHGELVKLLREEVCIKRGKDVIYRTWDYAFNAERGFLHTQPEYYIGVSQQVEPHPHLYFAIKHTEGDYFRTFPFNRTIGIGNHKQIIEVQCQREYEAKGAYANYVAESVINGFEEYDGKAGMHGLKDLVETPLYAGVWTWSRGGGWGGPYLKSEFWCEANAYVLAQWAMSPTREEKDIFLQFAKMKGFDEKSASTLHDIALMSPKAILRGRASNVVDISSYELEWTRDDAMRGYKFLNGLFDRAIAKGEVDKIIQEKREAMEMWQHMQFMAENLKCADAELLAAVRASIDYGCYFYKLTHYAWSVMLMGKAGRVEALPELIKKYDATKSEWVDFCEKSPWAATMFKLDELDASIAVYR